MAVDIFHPSSRRIHNSCHLLYRIACPPSRDAQRSGTTEDLVGAVWHFGAELGQHSTLGHRHSNRREL